MTDELEKQFFICFGIEPVIEQYYHFCNKGLNCKECSKAVKIYPQITNHILLELILIIMHHEDLFGHSTNIHELKDNTLKQLIETYNKFSTCVTYDG